MFSFPYLDFLRSLTEKTVKKGDLVSGSRSSGESPLIVFRAPVNSLRECTKYSPLMHFGLRVWKYLLDSHRA